jgi:rhamnose transport system substrate-binding protein
LPRTGLSGWRRRFAPNGEHALLIALAAEIAIFAAIAPNFFTSANLFEILRFSVELGLIALAETAVILTGGIDLSVGSMMGLSAVIFAGAWQNLHVSLPVAALIALLTGLTGGLLNALLITRFDLPPLIVTLGTYSMFRGIAEGITHGAVNFTNFPASFLFLGQGYLWGVIPAQLPLFLIIFTAYYVLVHRSIIGRGLYAIGFTASGARYAGIPVRRRIGLVYVLAGLVSSIAAIIFVAHLGQTRADTGTGYELYAITAVVLGGTSVFGGRGTLWGTVLGLLSLSVLQNGVQLAALPSELTGVLTGALLILVLSADWLRARGRTILISSPEPSEASGAGNEDLVKNSQVAILCGTVLTGALIVAASNIWMVHSLSRRVAFLGSSEVKTGSAGVALSGKHITVAMMPKAKGDPYFVSCRSGAEEAAKELGIDLIWDGPTSLDAARQNEVVEDWITRQVDVVAVAVENKAGISTVLRKARQHNIGVLTWDSDAEPDARDYFVNQATPEGIANTLTDEAARLMGGKGQFAIITGALSAENQNLWIANIKKRMADKYPGLTLATILPSDDDRDKAFSQTQNILKVYPDVKLVMAISAPAVPGSGEAIRQSGRKDVDVIGLSLPSITKPYVHDGSVQTVVLWNTHDLGYATVYAAYQLAEKKIAKGATSMQAGRLGTLQIQGDQIILGAPLIINKQNIDTFDF